MHRRSPNPKRRGRADRAQSRARGCRPFSCESAHHVSDCEKGSFCLFERCFFVFVFCSIGLHEYVCCSLAKNKRYVFHPHFVTFLAGFVSCMKAFSVCMRTLYEDKCVCFLRACVHCMRTSVSVMLPFFCYAHHCPC